MVLHRPLEGKAKTVCIRRDSTGKWYATFSCKVVKTLLPSCDTETGLDVGLSSFATLSNGESIENPRFFRKDEKALAKAQRNLSKQEKGTLKRKKSRKVVSRIHERIRNRRKDFAHQQSRKIANRFGLIVVEDIHVNRMVHNHCLAKSIHDAAWSEFLNYLTYKAEWAGRRVIAVNPAYTSQNCSSCGHRQHMPLSARTYHCPCCDMVLDRDHNAALNILALGRQSLGLRAVEAPSL